MALACLKYDLGRLVFLLCTNFVLISCLRAVKCANFGLGH